MIPLRVCPTLVVVALLTATTAFAQRPMLVLQKRNPNKSAVYEPGDVLSYYLRGSHEPITRTITAIERDTIVFGNRRVGVRDIAAIHIDEKTKWWIRFKYSQVLIIGGVGYMLLESINSGDVDRQTLVIGSSAVALGVVSRVIFPHRIRLTHRTRLRTTTG